MNALMRFEPARGFRRELDRLFDELLPTLSSDAAGAGWAPALDVAETDGAYLVRFDLPGLEADDVEVHFEDGILSVRGERATRSSEAREGLLRQERSFGAFFRSVRLPRGTDPAGVEAAFENGVLAVTIPKAEESRPHRIEIRTTKALPAGGDGAPTPEAPVAADAA